MISERVAGEKKKEERKKEEESMVNYKSADNYVGRPKKANINAKNKLIRVVLQAKSYVLNRKNHSVRSTFSILRIQYTR